MDTFQADLDTKGYAVIESVLDDDQCDKLTSGFWNFWSRLTNGKIQKDDPKTWKAIYDYFPTHGMLIQHFAIGHMQEIWDLRCHKTVVEVFEKIWKTSDLTVSFDGASTGFAPETTGRGWHKNDWLHLDQSPHRNEFECVQSWLCPHEVGSGDGTLMVLEGSHKQHAAFAKKFGLDKDPKCKSDWFKLEDKHVDWYLEQGCKRVTIECPKGSMVLWESRTVHAGRGAVKGRDTASNRMVAYISMLPTSKLKKQEVVKKQNALLAGRHTSHWAAGRVKLFAKIPRTYGKALPAPKEFQPPLLTEQGARLAGWHNNPKDCPLLLEDPEARRIACLRACGKETDSEQQEEQEEEAEGEVNVAVVSTRQRRPRDADGDVDEEEE